MWPWPVSSDVLTDLQAESGIKHFLPQQRQAPPSGLAEAGLRRCLAWRRQGYGLAEKMEEEICEPGRLKGLAEIGTLVLLLHTPSLRALRGLRVQLRGAGTVGA